MALEKMCSSKRCAV